MVEILFQDEIDSLIESLSTGEINPDDYRSSSTAQVKSFDFYRPNKFSKEQLIGLETVHNNFAKMFSNFLSVYLRSNIKIRVSAVEQLTYEDFVSSIPSPTLITVFSLEPLKRTAIMEANMQFVHPVLDLMFGGTGKATEENRSLTEIELAVMKKLLKKILEIFSMAWSEIFEIKAAVESLETNPRINQTITPKETVAVITFDAFVGKIGGLINICIPHVVLDPVMNRLSDRYWLTEGLSSPNLPEKDYIEKTLCKVKAGISVLVGKTDIQARDLLGLQKGDILQLDRTVSENMDLFVDDLLKFKVKPGITGNKMAVQILTDIKGD